MEQLIEAVLFYKNEPVKLRDIARMLEANEADVGQALVNLSQSLTNRGIALVQNADEYSLVTAPSTAALIERLTTEELSRDLSPASLETLSIVAYRGPVSRKEIEYIRGVNSSFSLRSLLMRGLIERESSRLDERIFLYKPSTDLLLHLGITSIETLPEWQAVRNEMKKAEESLDMEE